MSTAIMTENSYHDTIAIIVAARADNTTDRLKVVVEQAGLVYLICNDVYSAVEQIAARATEQRLIVIGSIEELSPEHKQFFRICSSRPATVCCCIITNVNNRTIQSITAAIRHGALIISKPDELAEALNIFVQTDTKEQHRSGRDISAGNQKVSGFERVRLTDRELGALLGMEK